MPPRSSAPDAPKPNRAAKPAKEPKAPKEPKPPKAPKPPKEPKPAKPAKPAKPTKAAQARDLTKELGQLLSKSILPDLRTRVRHEPEVRLAMARQHEAERKAQRTADDFDAWIDRTLEQIGVAWVLSLVFLRTLEDRGLLDHARLAGPGALDSEGVFFELFPSLGVGDYLYASFRELSRLPGAREVFAPKHNPAWRLSPSGPVLRELVAFFREGEPASGEAGEPRLVWRFDGSDTRFLGDLYQDVSASVRERYALLQTPDFVEALILDQTLTPAIAEYGLETVRVLDPTCGSGHFLLGAFRRLFEARQRAFPASPAKTQAGLALERVYGTDINPYAVAIARFRLLLAYLEAAGLDRLSQAPELPANLVVVDSLAYGAEGASLALDFGAEALQAQSIFAFRLDDAEGAKRVLGQRYHSVVGNPPYIVPKDGTLRKLYARTYRSCHMNYALSVPFTERFFQLAEPNGFVGLINANSFMKREFGKLLVEQVLPGFELTRVIDTSGAYIPGHGTPTVLLFGRNRRPLSRTVRAVLGKRGEPSTPETPADGLVWSSLRDHLDEVGFENDYITVAELESAVFAKHPWSLGGGGAADLKELLETRAKHRLGDVIEDVGFGVIIGEDELYLRPRDARRWSELTRRPLVIGEGIRDWSLDYDSDLLYPFDHNLEPFASPSMQRELWPWRRVLEERVVSGSTTMKQSNRKWFDVRRLSRSKLRTPLSIAFAFVATHNHFVLDRGGKVFNRSAPIIKLPEGATEDEHLALLAYLNSSTACFWMKQVFYPKATTTGDISVEKGKPEANRYEFAGTGLLQLPMPPTTPAQRARLSELSAGLEQLASRREGLGADGVINAVLEGVESRTALELHRSQRQDLLHQCVALQEELDWFVYELFGLCSARTGTFEPCAPEGRAFLGSERRANSLATTPDESPLLALIEDPLYKRPWWGRQGVFGHGTKELSQEVAEAVSARVQSFAEAVLQEPRVMSLRALESALRSRPELTALEQLLDVCATGRTLGEVLQDGDAVPYLSALRYTDAGLDKRAQWERTWKLQRDEDAGLSVGKIPVPPKYDQKDYRDASAWRLRGKLDVPKERFIAYPGAESDDDTSPLYGWAGWDHLQQATALAALYHERKVNTGWGADDTGRARLVPLLAGLLELVPWIQQWHAEPHDDFGGESPGDWYARYVEAEAKSLGKSLDDLRAWRPEAKKGGRKKG